MSTSLRHIGIVVQDLDECVRFWEDNFGFMVRADQIEKGIFIENLLGIPNVNVQTVKMKSNTETEIELLKFYPGSAEDNWEGSVRKIGITHIALNVPNLDEVLDNLLRDGYSPIHKPQISDDANFKVCYIAVVEGLLLELVEKI